MRSLRLKIILLIAGCLLLSTVSIGCVSIIQVKSGADSNAARIMNLLCQTKADEINSFMHSVEESTEILASYTESEAALYGFPEGKGEGGAGELSERLEGLAANIAAHTDRAMDIYVRFNPEFSTPQSGLFISRESQGGNLINLPLTDLSHFSPEDVEHVGWYYIPAEKGGPVWLEPYLNKNIGVYMISYVVPVYRDGKLLAIVGMDIDFEALGEIVDSTAIYRSGYGFLADSRANIIYHKDMEMNTAISDVAEGRRLENVEAALQGESGENSLASYTYRGEEKKMAFRPLRNGMRFAVSVPASELEEPGLKLMNQIIGAVVINIIIFLLIALAVGGRLLAPIESLNKAVRQIASGNLDITVDCRSKDEIGALAKNFMIMVEYLSKCNVYMNRINFTDSLTGAGNKAAYLTEINKLETSIAAHKADFTVAAFKIGDYSQMNNTLGYGCGNMAVVEAYKLISRYFPDEGIYRTSADGFTAIAREKGMEENFRQCRREIGNGTLCLLSGMASFDEETDKSYNDVAMRAESQMASQPAGQPGVLDTAGEIKKEAEKER